MIFTLTPNIQLPPVLPVAAGIEWATEPILTIEVQTMSCQLLPRTLTTALAVLILTAGCSKSSETPPAGATAVPSSGVTGHPPLSNMAPAVASGRSITVRVLVGQTVAGKVGANDTVYIYARAPEENGQMVALVKRTASELPVTVTLDDSASLGSNLRLSGLPVVVIGARISKKGDLAPHPGDLEGTSAPIPATVKETVVVAVSRAR